MWPRVMTKSLMITQPLNQFISASIQLFLPKVNHKIFVLITDLAEVNIILIHNGTSLISSLRTSVVINWKVWKILDLFNGMKAFVIKPFVTNHKKNTFRHCLQKLHGNCIKLRDEMSSTVNYPLCPIISQAPGEDRKCKE